MTHIAERIKLSPVQIWGWACVTVTLCVFWSSLWKFILNPIAELVLRGMLTIVPPHMPLLVQYGFGFVAAFLVLRQISAIFWHRGKEMISESFELRDLSPTLYLLIVAVLYIALEFLMGIKAAVMAVQEFARMIG